MGGQLGRHRVGQVVAHVEHGAQQALDLQRRIEPLIDALDGIDQRAQAFQRVELALHRHDDRVRRGQRVQRQQRQCRRAVDQDEVVALAQRRQHGLEPLLAHVFAHQLDLDRGQVDIARQQVEALGSADDDVAHRGFAQQHFAHRVVQRALVDAAAGGRVALRVDVDQQHPLGRARERGRQVDRGGGLADPAFLVGDGDDAGHAARPLLCGLLRRKWTARAPV